MSAAFLPTRVDTAGFSSTVVVLAVSTVFYLTYIVFEAIYGAYFGPLSGIPGPRLRAISKLPDVLSMCRGTKDIELPELHRQYGPVVRIRPNELSYADGARSWKTIYGFKSPAFKDPDFYWTKRFKGFSTHINGVDSIIEGDNENHSRQRKVLTHSFADKTLRQIEPLLKSWVGKLSDRFKASAGTPVDMVSLYNCTTFDIMGDVCFAEDLGMLAKGEVIEWVKIIFGNIKRGSIVRALQSLHPSIDWFVTNILLQRGPVKALRLVHWNFTKDRIDRRLQLENPDRQDLWTTVIKSAESPGGLTLDEQHSNASTFMIAGTETTATALSGITFHLLKNPQTLEKLTQEVRSTFQSFDDISLDAVARLKYTNAVIQEGLRMYPPIPSILPRRVPQGGLTILDEFIPAGTTVGVHQLATYRQENNFKDPYSFRPERWLNDPKYKDDQLDSLEPFLTGPRNCIGKNLAWHEMRLILAATVLQFDLQLCEESEKWADQKIFMLWDKPELMCKLTPVKA